MAKPIFANTTGLGHREGTKESGNILQFLKNVPESLRGNSRSLRNKQNKKKKCQGQNNSTILLKLSLVLNN